MDAAQSPMADAPFTIVGSGFCADRRGVVVTCAHVIEAFMQASAKDQIAAVTEEKKKAPGPHRLGPVRTRQPFALFFVPRETKIWVACVGVTMVNMATDMDLGVLRLPPHEAFVIEGFPAIAFESFDAVQEGMDIGVCGFPLGNELMKRLGTVTSSFTRGILSSIIPPAGIDRQHIHGFQLEARATHGNSGGPVFCWNTGKVFGVLSSGIDDQYGSPLFTHAESVYKVLDTRMIETPVNPPMTFATTQLQTPLDQA
jgi:S1-C subfamily serine protease